jgi:eukaryotic-like serine/threonine-protein kinase
VEEKGTPVASGTVLGRFRLEERLGSGGMGQVYRARDIALDRDVAIKLLPPEAVATPERRRRFETEAKVVATLSHPGIVPVYDIGESGGIPYIVQELVSGQTVDELIWKGGALPVDRVAECGIEVAEALAKAHDAGILHRDVKPGNLIIDVDGRVRVFDFGLAKILEQPGRRLGEVEPVTNDGMVVGTVHYMSPEQAQGHEVDARSDIFSLGIVLYEMATRRHPFDGPSAVDVMHAIVYEPAAPIDVKTTPLPEAFLSILEKALEKRPDERYQSTRELSADLKRFLRRSRDVSALRPLVRDQIPTITVPAVRRLWWRRPAAAAGALGLLLLAVGVWARQLHVATPHPPTAIRNFLQTDFREEDPVFSPDGKGFVYASNEAGDYGIYFRLISSSSPIRLTDIGGDNRFASFSPDGGTVLFTHEDPSTGLRSIMAVPTLGGPVRRILDRGEQPHLSHDARRLLFIRRTGQRTALVVANADGTGQQVVVDGGVGQLLGARFSHDESFIAYLLQEVYPNARGDVWKVPSGGGKPVRLTYDTRDVWGHVDLLHDDSAILFSSSRTGTASIWMVPSHGGEAIQVVPASSWLLSPSLSPDGHSILAQSRRFISDAWEFSLADGRGRQLTNCGSVWAPARLPDGRLLYGDWTLPGDLEIFLEDPRGTRTRLVIGGTPRPSLDGRHVYFATTLAKGDRVIAVMDTAGGPPKPVTNGAGREDDWPDPSPDEKHVVFVRTDGEGRKSLQVVEVATGTTRLLCEGDMISPRATSTDVVYRTCATDTECGIYVIPLVGGTPRLLVKDGWYPAPTPDGKTVYAWAGRKHDPYAVSVPIDGSAPPRRLFDFKPKDEVQFWAVHTLDVSPDGRSLIATRQWVNDDVLLLEGVFR